jgi:hypothetical protein
MAEKVPQNFANHTRFDPPFHFFVFPVFAITWIISLVLLIEHPGFLSAWRLVAMTALVLLALKARLWVTRLQDRIIRLEERLRLAGLLPEAQRAQIAQLSEDQLIGLRFASDDEAGALVQRCLSEKLRRKEIKKGVRNWRPDYWRV